MFIYLINTYIALTQKGLVIRHAILRKGAKQCNHMTSVFSYFILFNICMFLFIVESFMLIKGLVFIYCSMVVDAR